MTTFDNAKTMGYAPLVEKIQAASLCEYGLCPEPLMDRIFRATAKEGDVYVYAGLNNADVDCVLLDLLREQPEKVLSGIEIAGFLAGALAGFRPCLTGFQVRQTAFASARTAVLL